MAIGIGLDCETVYNLETQELNSKIRLLEKEITTLKKENEQLKKKILNTQKTNKTGA